MGGTDDYVKNVERNQMGVQKLKKLLHMGKINVVWIRPEEKSLDETHKDKPFTASVGFLVPPTLRRWATDYKKFENVGHLNNYIAVMQKKGYQFDEVWLSDLDK
jgi:hypothetical protein